MVIVIGSAPWATGSADTKDMQSAILPRASLLRSDFITRAYGTGIPFGELKVTRRTGVLPGGPGRCGFVFGGVRKGMFLCRPDGLQVPHSESDGNVPLRPDPR